MSLEKNKHRKEMYRAQEHISKNIRLLRYIKGLKQEDVADMLHMSRSSYCHLESGLMMPDLTTVCRLSELYDVSIDYLISFDISEQLLALLKKRDNETSACRFIEKYLKLSHGARRQIRGRIDALKESEREYNLFPWAYDEIERRNEK